MSPESLSEIVRSLTPVEQESVRQFIDYLRSRDASAPLAFPQAADEFIAEHPDLLERLAR